MGYGCRSGVSCAGGGTHPRQRGIGADGLRVRPPYHTPYHTPLSVFRRFDGKKPLGGMHKTPQKTAFLPFFKGGLAEFATQRRWQFDEMSSLCRPCVVPVSSLLSSFCGIDFLRVNVITYNTGSGSLSVLGRAECPHIGAGLRLLPDL